MSANIAHHDLRELCIVGELMCGKNNIHPAPYKFYLIKEFDIPKSDIEQWKECSLKSMFLLKNIIKVTSTNKRDSFGEIIFHEKYDNIEPFLTMVQEIKVPQHDQIDKENAGIPSELTNIT